MWAAVAAAFTSLFKIFLDIIMEKVNEPTLASDAPEVPKRYRDAWADCVRKFKSRIRPGK
jgi:hypothetical protein